MGNKVIFSDGEQDLLREVLDQIIPAVAGLPAAGTLGIDGLPASAESVVACAARGVDISPHGSRGLSSDLIEDSDLIFAMERSHEARIVGLCPEAANRCALLAPTGISDPIGRPQAVYDTCADQIEKAVKKIVSELTL